MSARIRRHNGGFQVEGSEVIHKNIQAAARAAGLPAGTYWDYGREQAMYPVPAGSTRNTGPRDFLITCLLVAVVAWFLW